MDAADWDARYRGTELVWTARPNRFVVAEALPLRPGRALDLAAGEGRNAVWLAERGWRVDAVDLSPVAAEKGRRLAAARGVEVGFAVRDLGHWSPAAGAYDLVLLAYLQVPAPLRRTVHRAAGRALAPGGALLVVAHHADNPAHGVGGPQRPEVLFTERDVAADLDGLGLLVERAERALRPTPAGDAVDVVLRARRPPRPGS
ncbi:MAG: methyltransferase domain-containing protein [Thermoleophilia bacterium]|nr:methyltransferase domain-containing protein [Thermoleophilia bacterium]